MAVTSKASLAMLEIKIPVCLYVLWVHMFITLLFSFVFPVLAKVVAPKIYSKDFGC